jgi:hypothetical protein
MIQSPNLVNPTGRIFSESLFMPKVFSLERRGLELAVRDRDITPD